MNIVVTGAGGFIGNAVTTDLVASGANVIACLRPNGSRKSEARQIYNGLLGGPGFSNLMREICYRNGGTFIALQDL